jgi:hypothetical protein
VGERNGLILFCCVRSGQGKQNGTAFFCESHLILAAKKGENGRDNPWDIDQLALRSDQIDPKELENMIVHH